MQKRQVKVGCAGWSIPAAHAHLFGPGDSMLARYATRFSIVEINSSFYRPHQTKTYERWAAAVSRGFRFSVKVPQTISHELALRGAGPVLDRFLPQAEGLGQKLGGFLLQLPPSLTLDARVASTFFRSFRSRSEAGLVCEPRHASWFTARADELFKRFGVSRIAADPARVPEAALPGAEPGWPYWRWHGSPRMYYSDYTQPALAELASQVDLYRKRPTSPWVIFDNTTHGFAAANAAALQDLFRPGAAKPAAKKRTHA
ncbi:DUF72 domain-containing protein [Pseudoxanthomonas gei]|uniref:DUF72 domain-containing protein n=1 Tax=Pseudoxanthomonas gei TaxID=1383030 RepID=A0ABX0ADU3_9GAMM|nr:DUF72 domain-containing protein [Pseudoxanthomonas gei]NDK38416.1 DUF72 domain-containing protein [Pseudoxanthomonas gei]